MEMIVEVSGVLRVSIDDFLAEEGELLAFFCVSLDDSYSKVEAVELSGYVGKVF
jgi:hypothetical protein